MLFHIPNSTSETFRVIMRTKANPVATLSSLDVKMMNPEY